MSRYWAPSRWAGSGRLAGEIRSSEVESPMCATDWQEVRGPGTVFAAARGAAVRGRRRPDLSRREQPAPRWGRSVPAGAAGGRRPRRGRSCAAVVRGDAAGGRHRARRPRSRPRRLPRPARARPPGPGPYRPPSARRGIAPATGPPSGSRRARRRAGLVVVVVVPGPHKRSAGKGNRAGREHTADGAAGFRPASTPAGQGQSPAAARSSRIQARQRRRLVAVCPRPVTTPGQTGTIPYPQINRQVSTVRSGSGERLRRAAGPSRR